MSVAEATEPTAGVEETLPTAEVPEAPEGVAPSAPGDEPAITEPAASLATRPRGPDGRFIKADGTQASEAEHAAIEAAAPASPPSPTPATPAPSTPPGEPFVFRADGQKIPIPGASLSPDGSLKVPAEQVPAIRQLLAEGVAHRGSWRQKEQDFERRVQEAGAVQEARATKYNHAAIHLLGIVEQLMAENPRELDLVRKEVGIMLREADLKAPRIEQPKAEPPSGEQLEQAARQTLDGYLDELLETPQARAVYATEEARRAVKARYGKLLNAFFQEQEGGDVVLHENAVDAVFMEELQDKLAAREATEKARKAAEFNAKRAQPAAPVPPVVSGKAPPAAPAPSTAKYTDRDAWRRANGMV